MDYELSNGKIVSFYSNTGLARFMFLCMPFKGLSFKETPKLVLNKEVEDIVKLAKCFINKRAEREKYIQSFDDDIPF